MWAIKIILWIGAICLFFIGIFGGVLDIFSLIGIQIHQGWLVSIALFLLLIEREVKVLTLDWQLNSKRDLQKRIDKLAEFRKSAINDLYAKTPDANDFDNWVNNFKEWEESLVNYLKEEFPFAVSEMFEDLGVIPVKNYIHLTTDKDIQGQHLHYLGMISKILSILESVIQENTSVTIIRQPKFIELFSFGPEG